MVKCEKHIDSNSLEWCWKCQELTDKERLESIKSLNKLKEIKLEDIFNDEKREKLKKFISEHKQK
jgi:Mg2+ and Co2+ transporter CorA